MNRDDNEMLTALSKFWKWEADWMTCRACKRHLIASRDGEPFAHAAGCKNAELLHPWRSLRLILNNTHQADACCDGAEKIGQGWHAPTCVNSGLNRTASTAGSYEKRIPSLETAVAPYDCIGCGEVSVPTQHTYCEECHQAHQRIAAEQG